MAFILALAQVNPHVGALEENLRTMVARAWRAWREGAHLIVFPELVLTGYPPEDLLHKPVFLRRLAEAEQSLHRELAAIGIDAVYGSVRQIHGKLFNAGVVVVNGEEAFFSVKWRLPNYGVFDERRYFEPGREIPSRPFSYRGVRLGITICEDIWHAGPPTSLLAGAGAELILNLNASPYHMQKQEEREGVVAQRISEHGLPVAYVNIVGGQDELIFDGGSFAMNRDGVVIARSRHFRPDRMLLHVERTANGAVRLLAAADQAPPAPYPDAEQEVYSALCLGLQDYVRKNGFPGVVFGLSGGIDSALTAVICADSLGKEQVSALMMPSLYTSRESLEDAAEIARRLGIRLSQVPIGPLFDLFRDELAAEFTGLAEDVTEENIQSRVRGTLLMAVSNKTGKLLVTTGNKSEISVGYATLYGDMAGGFAVIKDLLKGMVYRLAHARNLWAEAKGEEPPIPERVLERAPTAELRDNQKDSDSLPPYPVLDEILRYYVEEERGLEEIVAQGHDPMTVARVIRLVDKSEYKRRQAPPGVRITRRAFGKDRRYPITNGFRDE